MDWWYNNSGLNLLKGVLGDETNPIRLPDASIVEFLRRIPAARDSFERLVPTMLEEEQVRLRQLALSCQHLDEGYRYEDAFQRVMNRQGVRTAGRYGGTRRGGN